MPGPDGWHDEGFFHDGKMWRWHTCPLSERDTLVHDTPDARAKHERECRARAQTIRSRLRRVAKANQLKGLRKC